MTQRRRYEFEGGRSMHWKVGGGRVKTIKIIKFEKSGIA